MNDTILRYSDVFLRSLHDTSRHSTYLKMLGSGLLNVVVMGLSPMSFELVKFSFNRNSLAFWCVLCLQRQPFRLFVFYFTAAGVQCPVHHHRADYIFISIMIIDKPILIILKVECC